MNIAELFETGVRKYADSIAEVKQIDQNELALFVKDLGGLTQHGFMGTSELAHPEFPVAVLAACGPAPVKLYEALMALAPKLPAYTRLQEVRGTDNDVQSLKSEDGLCMAIVGIGHRGVNLIDYLMEAKPHTPEFQEMLAEAERASAEIEKLQESN